MAIREGFVQTTDVGGGGEKIKGKKGTPNDQLGEGMVN